MYLTKFLLLLVPVFTSALTTDASARRLDMTIYTIFPVDPSNFANINETKALLEQIPGVESVDSTPGILHVSSEENNLMSAISEIKGVQRVKIQSKNQAWATSEPSRLLSRDDSTLSLLYLVDMNVGADSDEIESFLKGKAQPQTSFTQLKNDDGVTLGWEGVALTSDARDDVQNYPGVRGAWRFQNVQSRAIEAPDHRSLSTELNETLLKDKISIRAPVTWTKQEKADWSLAFISAYANLNFQKFTDFVYPADPGKGSFIYVMDQGINVNVLNDAGNPEFPKHELLQTDASRGDAHQQPDTDESVNSHGTGVASKALGAKHGLAKEATLISVKSLIDTDGKTISEFRNSINLIVQDIKKKKRELRSVVVYPHNTREAYKRDDWINTDVAQSNCIKPLKDLFDLGVPFVAAAGNEGKLAGREEIDTIPAIFQGPDLPLIIVGAVMETGEEVAFSQNGRYLTTHAPGLNIQAQSRDDRKSFTAKGTSYATPLAGGHLAICMNFDTKPWNDNLKGIDRVTDIAKFIESGKSGWEKSSVLSLWNGATLENHKAVGANTLALGPNIQNKRLSVILQDKDSQTQQWQTTSTYNWLFFQTDKGVEAACTQAEKDAKLSVNLDDQNSPMMFELAILGKTFDLGTNLDNMGTCQYKGNSNGGALTCDFENVDTSISCTKVTNGPQDCKNGINHNEIGFCEF